MFEVGVVKRFEASHALQGDFGPATRMHSHDYRVEVIVKGAKLNSDGTLVDISALSNASDEAISELSGRTLNELEPFESENSTAEAVSKFLSDKIVAKLSSGAGESLHALIVRVWEGDDAFASFDRKI